MSGKFLSPDQCIRDGFLTLEESRELQVISNRYKTVLYVVGSRAKGAGRNIGRPGLPVGKGPHTRSDIDIRIDGQCDIDSRGGLSRAVSNISGGAGSSSPLVSYEAAPPAIIFKPA